MSDLDTKLYWLWDSNVRLYDRFGATRTIQAQLDLIDKELKEFKAEALAGTINARKLAEEGGDIVMTVVGALIAAGLSYHDLVTGFDAVIKKNNDKQPGKEHYLNQETGKITRLQPIPHPGGGGT